MSQTTVIEELVVKLKADVEKAEQDISKVKEAFKNLDSEAKKTVSGGWMTFVSSVKEAASPLTKQNELFKNLTGLLGDTGKAASGLFKVLLTNPFGMIVAAVGALVGALAALVKIFLSTEEGGDRLRRVFAGIKEVYQSFIGILQETALGLGSVIEGIFNFDSQKIREGLDRVKEGWSNLSGQIKEAYNRGKEMFDMQERLQDLQIKNQVEIAKLQERYNQLLEEAAQKERGSERIGLLRQAQALNDQIIKKKKQELQLEIEIMKESFKANETSKDQKLELAKLEAQMFQLEAQRARINKRISAEIASTTRGEIEMQKELLELKRQQESMEQTKIELEAFEALNDLAKDITDRFGTIDDELYSIDQSLEEVDESVNQLAESHLEAMQKMQDDAKIYQQEMQLVASLISDTLVNAFLEAVKGGVSFGEALKEAFRQILIQLTAMIAKALIFRAIVSALGGGVVGSGLLTAGQAIFSLGGNRGIGSFAQGGIVRGPQLAIVGDNPGREELIIPSEKYGDFFKSGPQTNVNVSVSGSFVTRADRQVVFFERANKIIKRG